MLQLIHDQGSIQLGLRVCQQGMPGDLQELSRRGNNDRGIRSDSSSMQHEGEVHYLIGEIFG